MFIHTCESGASACVKQLYKLRAGPDLAEDSRWAGGTGRACPFKRTRYVSGSNLEAALNEQNTKASAHRQGEDKDTSERSR